MKQFKFHFITVVLTLWADNPHLILLERHLSVFTCKVRKCWPQKSHLSHFYLNLLVAYLNHILQKDPFITFNNVQVSQENVSVCVDKINGLIRCN